MKKHFSFVCSDQDKALQILIKALVEKYKPERILCFGRVRSSNQSSSCFLASCDQSTYHYFLLMITSESTRIEHQVQDFVNYHFTAGKITILSHGRETIHEAVLKNSRFFSTVSSQGCLLYASDGLFHPTIAPELNPIQTFEKAKKHYEHRFPMAKGFLNAAMETWDSGHYNVAIFILHQVMEQSLAALIRVYIAYRTDIHHLGRLLDLCRCFLTEPDALFPRNTKEEQRLFMLLNNSYSAARYKDSFDVSGQDATLLYEKVGVFLESVEHLCKNQLAAFEKEAKEQKSILEETNSLLEMEVCHG
ncbi:HEPN domain-containing protein [Solitalea lacus]|uniref:HEPN domain-containing protein n=1 Tax=Solitalea lacus TaxID=2911172 RepID=UPI001EDB401F|nr:HEPN domain-containing protein [Solitalea lacus]UKJ07903.1 HEPN domain-containing protein [Solitalea lacus]